MNLKITSIALVISALLCGGGMSVAAAEEPTTLAMFSYHTIGTAGDNLAVLNYGDTDTGYTATSGANYTAAKLFASLDGSSYKKIEWTKVGNEYTYKDGSATLAPVMAASKSNLWGSDPYFLIECPTKGYKSITVTAYVGGTNSGPKDYDLEYSTDGSNFTKVGDTAAISVNKNLSAPLFSAVALPTAAADADMLYLKIISPDSTTISGGTYVGVKSGEAAINDVKICGTEISPSEYTAGETNQNAVKLNNDDTQYSEDDGTKTDAFYYTATTDAATTFSSLQWIVTGDNIRRETSEKAITQAAGGGSVTYGDAVNGAPYGCTAQVRFK